MVRLNSAIAFTALFFLASCDDLDNKAQNIELEDSPRLNFLVLLVDDLGYSDIGFYNPDSFYETPNIDSLAAEGVSFTDGYAASPICSPSRVALMTGKHPSRLDATDWFHVRGAGHRSENFNPAPLIEYLPLEEKTIAERLKNIGCKVDPIKGKPHEKQNKCCCLRA